MTVLDPRSPSLRSFHVAKLLAWNPRQLDLQADPADWVNLAEPEQAVVARLLALFAATQAACLRHLPAYSLALERRGEPIERQMLAAAHLFETARHVDAFDRWLSEVGGPVAAVGTGPFHGDPSYRALVVEDIPTWLGALAADASDASLMRAAATCHLVAAGVLLEAGLEALCGALRHFEILPGLVYLMELVRRDVTRHADAGAADIARLVAAGDVAGQGDDVAPDDDVAPGDDVAPAVEADLGGIAEPARLTLDDVHRFLTPRLHDAAGIIAAVLAPWGRSVPLGVDVDGWAEAARRQLGRRLAAVD